MSSFRRFHCTSLKSTRMILQVPRVFHNSSVRVVMISWEFHYGSMYVPRVFYDDSVTVATQFRESSVMFPFRHRLFRNCSVTTVLRFLESSIMDPFWFLVYRETSVTAASKFRGRCITYVLVYGFLEDFRAVPWKWIIFSVGAAEVPRHLFEVSRNIAWPVSKNTRNFALAVEEYDVPYELFNGAVSILGNTE
jgi:hypothetical protein